MEVKVPTLAESVADATILSWYKKIGEAVQENDKLVDIETDKVVLEVVAPQTGTLSEILKDEGETVSSEEAIAEIDTKSVQLPQSTTPTKIDTLPKTSPAVRKIAQEAHIDIRTVAHHGDRVTKADILAHQAKQQHDKKQIPEKPAPKIKPVHKSTDTPTPHVSINASGRPEERIPMTRLRKRAAERLLQAQQHSAILTTFNEIDMKPIMELRAKYKALFEKRHGVKLGFMSFFTKAATFALQKFPVINASITGEDVIYHGYYDIGIAVSSSRGLVVPILRDVDSLSFAEVEKGISDFARKAKETTLTMDDLTGGTFTITNGGVFGSMLSTPILNPPQSAILGMHNIVERPVAINGQVVIRPIMYVALSYDHRLIDGREAVQFLVTIKNIIEDPTRLLLDA